MNGHTHAQFSNILTRGMDIALAPIFRNAELILSTYAGCMIMLERTIKRQTGSPILTLHKIFLIIRLLDETLWLKNGNS